MTGPAAVLLARDDQHSASDRVTVLSQLVEGPQFDPFYRNDLIVFPADHPVFQWQCTVAACARTRSPRDVLCHEHAVDWARQRGHGVSLGSYARTAKPLPLERRLEPLFCRICPDRPAFHRELRLCTKHRNRWHSCPQRARGDFDLWLADQQPYPGFGRCRITGCPEIASSPLRLGTNHLGLYRTAGLPGGASLPPRWYLQTGDPAAAEVQFTDRALFDQWCRLQVPVTRFGELNLIGLPAPLLLELQWCLHAHALKTAKQAAWNLPALQAFVAACRRQQVSTMDDLNPVKLSRRHRTMHSEMAADLRKAGATPQTSRRDGYIDATHFGVTYTSRSGHFDLLAITQPWLRDLVWDFCADHLRSLHAGRTPATIDGIRVAAAELSAHLAVYAQDNGNDPHTITAEHIHRMVADLRHRRTHQMPFLAAHRLDGKPSPVTDNKFHNVLLYARTLMRHTLETGDCDRLGLHRQVILAFPRSRGPERSRSPYPDDVARTLAAESNLQLLASYDPDDWGLRDIWEAIVLTGRRAGEIRNLNLDCLGRYGGLPILWHDQTKVGRYDEAIRIPERLHQLLEHRQILTLARFADTHGGQQPTPQERQHLVLFPSGRRNPAGRRAVSSTWFLDAFRRWCNELDLGRWVPHQARHTLATNLLRHGATIAHVRRYLGQVSDRMAERYAKAATCEIEDILQAIWVAGPASAQPGRILSDGLQPMSREIAEALAIDLSRRSTPADGGLCTFQPVVAGHACPYNLNCHTCQHFVMSGADLLYWRRKQQQWASLAENAPDDTTANYLHQVFAPTRLAIDGLEKALAAVGLLDDALALDLRRPQDYFTRIWSTAFRATDLHTAARTSEMDS